MRHYFLGLIAILLTLGTAQAAQFQVTSQGRPVTGAEICFFRAGPSTTPITRFLKSSEVSCHSADKDVPVPSGDWNVFARKGREHLSERVELITEKTRPVELSLVPAGRIDATGWPLGEGENLFLYLSSSGGAIPLQEIGPAGPAIPLLVREGRIIRVGVPVDVKEGETTEIATVPAPDGADVIVSVLLRSLPTGSDAPPEISLVDARGRPHRNVTPMKLVHSAPSSSLAIFRGVSAGGATATLSGKRWKTIEAKADVAPLATVFGESLIARPSSRLDVHFWTTADLTTLRPPQPECSAELDPMSRTSQQEEVTKFTATLMICPDELNPIPIKCKRADSIELPMGELRGKAEFNDVPAGTHFVTFAHPGLPSILKRVEATEDPESSADIELRYSSFFGKITRGTEPVHGHVFGTVSHPDTGTYLAILSRLPAPGVPYSVTLCDGSGSYRFVPDAPPLENAEFNIEIPENRLVVEVADEAAGMLLKDATVNLAATRPDGPKGAAHYAGAAGKTDDSGRLAVEPLLTNRELLVCASHPDYNTRCADPFTMKTSGEKLVRIELERAVKRLGRIMSGRPARGQLVWFSRDGRITEMIREFTETGEFTYRKPHAEGEIVALISADQPLYVFHHPRLRDDQTFEIVMPPAPRRSFSVTMAADSIEEGGFAALQIGEITVPSNALGWHLMARRIQASLRPGWTVHVPDVLETGPITVIFVPFSVMKRYEDRRIEMPFIPEAGSLPRQRLADGNSVTFR